MRRHRVVQVGAAPMPAKLADHHNDDQSNDHQRSPKKPCRLNHAIAADGDRFSRAHAAEHGHHVLANGYLFTEPDIAEHADHIVADVGVVVSLYAAEKIHDVMIGAGADVNVSKEDHNIAFNCAVGINIAEKADRVMNRGVARHVNWAAK